MIRLYVDMFGIPRIKSLTPDMGRQAAEDAARGVKVEVMDSFLRMATATKSTKFWPEARQAIGDPVISNGMATLEIRHKGVRLQWLGGTVKPTGHVSEVTGRAITSLLIPFKDSPIRGKSLAAASIPQDEVQVLLSVATKTPYLARIETQRVRRKTREFSITRKDGSKDTHTYANSSQKITPLGLLLKSVTIKAKPQVMPSKDQLQQRVIDTVQTTLSVLLAQS